VQYVELNNKHGEDGSLRPVRQFSPAGSMFHIPL